MSVRIILYEKAAMDRVKQKIYECFAEGEKNSVNKRILWLDDMYIKFQERIITINAYKTDEGIDNYLRIFLENEHVTLKYQDRIEYYKKYSQKPSLLITHG